MTDSPHDLPALMRDTIREVFFSWRVLVALLCGVFFGYIERNHTGAPAGLFFGPAAALFTLALGPLPWRALVPLEADGNRANKLARWFIAALLSLVLFGLLLVPYRAFVNAIDLTPRRILSNPRDIVVPALLFLVAGWGLARDVQLEQRHDRTLRTHDRLAAELEDARLHALRAELDPHFLFNALNAIASQCVDDPRAAEQNVVRLSSLLRAVLDTRRRPLHPLDDEVALAEDYLGLLAARFPQVRHRVDLPASLGRCMVPPLVLQPLLENAVRHGLPDKGEISITAKQTEPGTLELHVVSPGAFRGTREGGLGLELVERRVALAWGPDAQFTITAEGESTHARIVAPLPPAAQPHARSQA